MPNPDLRRISRKLVLLTLVLIGVSLIPAPTGTTGGNAEAAICYWAFYEWYYNASGIQCGYYNSCTGDRVYCNYAYKESEIFQCCN